MQRFSYRPVKKWPERKIDTTKYIRIFKVIILPFVLCGCEMWSLTLMEEHKLQVFKNKVLRKTFAPKKY
jgi:hypothetical protein